MKRKKKTVGSMILAALLTLSLASCGTGTNEQGVKISGESLDVNGVALRPDGEAAQIYENGGLKLLIPMEYNELLITETPQNDANGILFSVSEKASVEAAKAQGADFDGAGWLFSIGAVTEDALREALCYDMSGEEAFAKGADGQYYMYYHPTDVRLVRENYEDEEAMEQWSALNEWAATVPDTFITENSGLTAEKHGNSTLDMYLARIAYMDDVKYTLSATEHGPMEPRDVDPMPYLNRLMNGVTFEYADGEETPDGEYVVLSFPDDDVRFDFFRMEGKENYVRTVWSGDNETLYKASYADGAIKASVIMSEWYNALVTANAGEPLETSGFTGEEFVGEWQDEVSQRAVLSVKKTGETGVYDVLVHWGNSADSATQWRMRAVANAQDETLSYENGTKVEVTFPGDGPEQETVVWDNGAGYLTFRDGFLTWYDEQQTEAADCRFVKTA
ncbi:MAG: hypothetical protein IJR54_08420 [Oscillibacter sp.]|nr:hypothetical protein [Oscillibacter sp.]